MRDNTSTSLYINIYWVCKMQKQFIICYYRGGHFAMNHTMNWVGTNIWILVIRRKTSELTELNLSCLSGGGCDHPARCSSPGQYWFSSRGSSLHESSMLIFRDTDSALSVWSGSSTDSQPCLLIALGSAAVLTIPENRQTHVVSSAVILHLKIYSCMRQRRTNRDPDKSQSFHLPCVPVCIWSKTGLKSRQCQRQGPCLFSRGPRRIVDHVNVHRERNK